MDVKRSKSSQTSAEIIAGNDDLLKEAILFRLPEKDLVRFQLVCKHWQALVYTPSFSRLHKPRAFIFRPFERHDILYFSPILKAFHKLHFNHHGCTSTTKIIHSHNGLCLLELDGGKNYSVYNPTMNQSRVLKLRGSSSDHHDRPHPTDVCLGFDPSRSVHYKVFFIHMVGAKTDGVETYDSETDEWTSIDTSSTNDRPPLHLPTYCNNKLYSIVKGTSLGVSRLLDLKTGKFGFTPVIKTPITNKRGVVVKNSLNFSRTHYLTESNGHLRCVVTVDDCNGITRHLFLFELKEDNSGWLQLYKADLKKLVRVFPRKMNTDFSVIGIVRGADQSQTEEHVLLHVLGMVISYQFCDGNFERVLDLTPLRETYKEVLMQQEDEVGGDEETSDPYVENELFACYKLFPFVQNLAPV